MTRPPGYVQRLGWIILVLAVIVAVQFWFVIRPRLVGGHSTPSATPVPLPEPSRVPPPPGANPPFPGGSPAPNQFQIGLDQLAIGIIYLQDRRDVRLSPGQAREILPLLREAVAAFRKVEELSACFPAVLSAAQMRHIRSNAGGKISGLDDLTPTGEDSHVYPALLVLRRKAAKNPPPRPEASDEPLDVSLPDLADGIYRLEQTPDLALSPRQAAILLPIMEEINPSWKTVTRDANRIQSRLLPGQITYVNRLRDQQLVEPGAALDQALKILETLTGGAEFKLPVWPGPEGEPQTSPSPGTGKPPLGASDAEHPAEESEGSEPSSHER